MQRSVDWIRRPPEALRSVPPDNQAYSQQKVLQQQCSVEAYGDADYFLILAEIVGAGGPPVGFPMQMFPHTDLKFP